MWKRAKTLILIFSFFLNAGSPQAPSDWVIGVDADLSLGGASAGQAILLGVRLAADEINASGGLLGRKLRIEARDHGGIVLRGIENVKELGALSNMIGIVGGIHSNVILSELEVIHSKKIPYLIPWASADELVDNGRHPNFVFRLGGRDQYVGEFLVGEALKHGKRIGLLLESTVWGRSNLKALKKTLALRKIQPVAVEWIDRADSNVNVQISALQRKNPDVVIMALNAPEGALAVNTMTERGTPFRVLSHWGIAHENFFKLASASLKKMKVEFFQPFSFSTFQNNKKDALLKKLKEHLPQAENGKIDAASGIAHAYDLTLMLGAATSKSKSAERGKIRDALESLAEFKGVACSQRPPFTPQRHEAVDKGCFFLAQFSDDGKVIPSPLSPVP
ncbi:MAG: hypothetical protein RIR26_2210 [Pseudomonadota bacterium]|jgi:branched-chain amino acid transport system substrate-binding protein